MINPSHIMVFFTVASFMMGVVSLLPAFVRWIQERYASRVTSKSSELDKFFVRVKVPYMVGGGLAAAGVIGWFTGSWVIAAVIAMAGLAAPKIFLALWKNRRTAQFDEQLMDALILIGNALRSGLDIATGIELVSTNMKAPISEEFGQALNAYRLGGSLETALMEMTRRIPSRTLETTVVSIILQRDTGGNLIKTFEQLVQTIREESKLQKKVRAISAQGRTQVAFLSIFPWGMALLLYVLSPEMIEPALSQTWGQLTLAGLIVWELIGIVVTKRIVTVDV
jgi:tight adherence protein B